jgi:hypothetical protein
MSAVFGTGLKEMNNLCGMPRDTEDIEYFPPSLHAHIPSFECLSHNKYRIDIKQVRKCIPA